jgi:shikimate dehydrogenase
MKSIALLGKKLSHSFSPAYFKNKFKQNGLDDYQYELLELESLTDLRHLVNKREDLIGFNVTIPYKVEVLNYLDELDDSAKKIGAVNTVKIHREKEGVRMIGYNTDAHGFRFSIKPFLNVHHQKALILGDGGAAQAVAYVFDDLGIDYLFVSRNKKKSNSVMYSDLNEFAIRSYKLIVNCTPVGMFPNIDETLAIPHEAITADHLCVDLIYNPEETNFLRHAKEKGAIALNGLSMLHLQADKAFEIFMG